MPREAVPDGTLQPHPFALMLPVLTKDEYRALKEDIRQNGILYPVITDEDDRILDGVHRVRIAGELGLEPPVARHEGLTDERKLHLAVGLNMRRRHLNDDRRRALVRKLHAEEKLSVRKIADITGWSKSTVDRDLKESPFESVVRDMAELQESVSAMESDAAKEITAAIAKAGNTLFGWADSRWKAGDWPPADDEEMVDAGVELMMLKLAIRVAFAPEGNDEFRVRLEKLSPVAKRWSEDAEWRPVALARARELGLLDRIREWLSPMGQR